MWRLHPVHALALVVALSACEGGQRLAGVSDTTFVRTMAELRLLHSRAWPDSATKAAALDSILQSRGLTPEELEAAARALAQDPERAVEIWRAIHRHIQGDTLGPVESPETGSRGGSREMPVARSQSASDRVRPN